MLTMSQVVSTKKIRFLILLVFWLVPSISFAGSWNEWIYQDPYPTSQTLWAVKFITPQKGWVAGENGSIFYTEDGGENWESQKSGTEEVLNSLFFVNEKLGWAVGNGGVILHTENGGKNWIAQNGASTKLTKVYFLNEKEGWAVGSDGIVLHTIDGGKKWNQQETGIKRSMASVDFINPNVGWILAGDELYRTINAGKTWERSQLDVKIEQHAKLNGRPIIPMVGERLDPDWDRGDIVFVSEKTGWAVVGLWFIFHTTDGGKTWENQLTTGAMSYGLYGIAAGNENTVCAIGTSIFCLEGDKNWKEQLGIRPAGTKSMKGFVFLPRRISFSGPATAWIVGVDGLIMKTEDGGKVWKVVSRRDKCGVTPFFVSQKIGWLYFPRDSSICMTRDGGRTWIEQEVGINVIELFFLNDSIGWAVGREQVGKDRNNPGQVYEAIKRTTDGGKTWTIQYKELTGKDGYQGLFGVYFANPNMGWVVGDNGSVLRTVDGGKVWERQKIEENVRLRPVWFKDTQNGWIIGSRTSEEERTGFLFRTRDGGKEWKLEHTINNVDLFGITFSDEKSGWVVGQTEYGAESWLLHTDDDGKTWSERSVGNLPVGYVSFLDKDRGVLSPEKEVMFVTTDGGKTWNKQKAPLRKYPWHFSEIFKSEGKH